MLDRLVRQIPVIISVGEGKINELGKMLINLHPRTPVSTVQNDLNNLTKKFARDYILKPNEDGDYFGSLFDLEPISKTRKNKLAQLTGIYKHFFDFELVYPEKNGRDIFISSQNKHEALIRSQSEGREIFATLAYFQSKGFLGIPKTTVILKGIELERDRLNLNLKQTPEYRWGDKKKLEGVYGYVFNEKGLIVKKDSSKE